MRQTDPSSRFEGPSAALRAGQLRLEEGELLIGVIAAHHVGGPGFHQDPKDLSLDRALGDVSLKLVFGITRYRRLIGEHQPLPGAIDHAVCDKLVEYRLAAG